MLAKLGGGATSPRDGGCIVGAAHANKHHFFSIEMKMTGGGGGKPGP